MASLEGPRFREPSAAPAIAIILFFFLFMVAAVSIIATVSSKEDSQTVENQEWCEVAKVGSNGTLSYASQEQNEELLVLATAQGPVLMAKCK
jgi:flagellar basal body-associated protein FliL